MTAEPIPPVRHTAVGPLCIRLLGPLELGEGPTPTARLTRKTLALLAMRANTFVSVPDFIQELWEGDPPNRDLQSVQTYVLRLRQLGTLDITFHHHGYVLHMDPLNVDALRFADYVERARCDLTEGDSSGARDRLTAAFSMWRGRPLEDIRTGPLLSNLAARLEDTHQTALNLRWEMDLWAGRHWAIVDDLAAAVRDNPAREDTAAKLMLALYRSNRRAEALRVFGQVRKALVDEYGLEPHPALCRLQAQILAGDPALDLNGDQR